MKNKLQLISIQYTYLIILNINSTHLRLLIQFSDCIYYLAIGYSVPTHETFHTKLYFTATVKCDCEVVMLCKASLYLFLD